MSIKNWPDLTHIESHPFYTKFLVKIPIMDYSGRQQGQIDIFIQADTAKKARSIARKEMIKLARISTNRAEVIDDSPKEKNGASRRF